MCRFGDKRISHEFITGERGSDEGSVYGENHLWSSAGVEHIVDDGRLGALEHMLFDSCLQLPLASDRLYDPQRITWIPTRCFN